MKANKRGSKKGKTSPMAVNLGAWLRCYASDEQSAVEAMKRAQSKNDGVRKCVVRMREKEN